MNRHHALLLVASLLLPTLLGGCADPADSSADDPSGTVDTQAPSPEPEFSAPVTSNGESYRIRYAVLTDDRAMPALEPFPMVVEVTDPDGDPVDDVELTLDAAMPHHAHGVVQMPDITESAPGRFEVYFDITRGPRTERAQVEVHLD